MPDANLQPDIDALKAANAAVAAKLEAEAAKLTVAQQQVTDLRAEITNTANLGK